MDALLPSHGLWHCGTIEFSTTECERGNMDRVGLSVWPRWLDDAIDDQPDLPREHASYSDVGASPVILADLVHDIATRRDLRLRAKYQGIRNKHEGPGTEI